jgi:hypothetical protein
MATIPTDYVSESLAAYPALLNRYLVAKLITGIETSKKLETAEPRKHTACTAPPTELDAERAHVNHAEKVTWTRRLRGDVGPTDKEAAGDLGIGGMKDTAASVARLTYSQQFGAKLGGALTALLGSRLSRVQQTCELMGTKVPDAKPPAEAVAAVRAMICEHTEHVPPTMHTCSNLGERPRKTRRQRQPTGALQELRRASFTSL